MRIGINASFLRKPDTGIGQVTRGFVDELIKNHSDKNDYFLYLEKEVDIELPKNFKKRVFLPTYKRDDLIRKIWWECCLLPKKAKDDKCDIFLSLYQCPTRLPKIIRHKMLVHDMVPKIFPDYLDNWRKKLYFFLVQKAIKQADEIFTVSEWSKKDIHKFLEIPNEEIKIAYPSIGKEFLEKSTEEKDNKVLEKHGIYGRYIFYVGGFDFRKNISGLLQGYAKLLQRYEVEDVSLVLAGEDRSAFSPLFTDVKMEVESFGLKKKVKLIGFVKQLDMPALYRNCEIFMLPTLYEGFGLMALEAMASGAPTAVSKNSSLPEICGDACLFFNPYDPDEIARVMGKVLRNTKLRLRLGEKGKERAKRFTWKNFVTIILNK